MRLKIRKELSKHKQQLLEHVEKATFPEFILPILKNLNISRYYIQQPFGYGLNSKAFVAIIIELARIDGSLATLYLVQAALLINSIDKFGSDY